MNLSCYLEEEFERNLKEKGLGKKELPLKSGEAEELTEDIKNLVFFDFEASKEFEGTFQGEGKEYVYKDVLIKTWAFLDVNELPWLIPQWEDMNRPGTLSQDKEALLNYFKGFQHETPKEYLYKIIYNDPGDTNSQSKHKLTILRKKAG